MSFCNYLTNKVVVWFLGGQWSASMPHQTIPSHFKPGNSSTSIHMLIVWLKSQKFIKCWLYFMLHQHRTS